MLIKKTHHYTAGFIRNKEEYFPDKSHVASSLPDFVKRSKYYKMSLTFVL